MARITFSSDEAPKAAGPYSQAVVSGDHVFLSGQTPIDPATGTLVGGSLAEQTQPEGSFGVFQNDKYQVQLTIADTNDFGLAATYVAALRG